MTPKLEIHPADGDFVAATYTLDKTASVTGRGFSAFDAVANLRVYLQPFGYELPNVQLYASGGAHAGAGPWEQPDPSSVHGLTPDGNHSVPLAPQVPASTTERLELNDRQNLLGESGPHTDGAASGSDQENGMAVPCGHNLRRSVLDTTAGARDNLERGPISECESAVDRVFKQHLSTGRN